MAQESLTHRRIDSPVVLAAGVPTVLLAAVLISNYFYPNLDLSSISFLRNIGSPFHSNNGTTFQYDQNLPLVFIGGMPRSGARLLKTILEPHSKVRCGDETHILPRILGYREMWYTHPAEREMIANAKLTDDVMRAAFASFILEIIVRRGEPAERICTREPFVMRYADFVSGLFPNAKFLFMVRDGRATMNSLMTRKIVTREGYREDLGNWNTAIELMLTQCRLVGSDRCLIVYYEQLVTQPRVWLKKVTDFLNIPWEEAVMNHEAYTAYFPGKKSLDQISGPINSDSLSKWVGNIPGENARYLATIAPMLKKLGYNPDLGLADYRFPFNASDSVGGESGTEKLSSDSWLSHGAKLLQKDSVIPNESAKS